MTRHLLNLRFLHRRDQRDFVGTRENRTGLRPSSSYKCVLVIIILTISNLHSCSANNIMFWNLQRILWEDADPAWDQVDLPFVESDGLVWPIFAAFSTAQHQCLPQQTFPRCTICSGREKSTPLEKRNPVQRWIHCISRCWDLEQATVCSFLTAACCMRASPRKTWISLSAFLELLGFAETVWVLLERKHRKS